MQDIFKIKNVSKPDQLYETLKEEILYFDLLPGQEISEIEVADRFRVSRTPVRDAFKRLKYNQLLNITSQIKTTVELINLDTISSILYTREKVELAVLHELLNDISPIQIIKLQYMINEQEEIINDNVLSDNIKAKQFLFADNLFHQTLFNYAGHGKIWLFFTEMEHHYTRLRYFLNATTPESLTILKCEHGNIINALASGDTNKLEKAYLEHLYGGIRRANLLMLEYNNYFVNLKNSEHEHSD